MREEVAPHHFGYGRATGGPPSYKLDQQLQLSMQAKRLCVTGNLFAGVSGAFSGRRHQTAALRQEVLGRMTLLLQEGVEHLVSHEIRVVDPHVSAASRAQIIRHPHHRSVDEFGRIP
jgi:hypothetical protein